MFTTTALIHVPTMLPLSSAFTGELGVNHSNANRRKPVASILIILRCRSNAPWQDRCPCASSMEPGEIGTDDGQALVTFPSAAVAPQRGESSVKVRITPLDPATVAPAPRGHPFDGNAYRVEASYAVSGKPAVLATSLTVVLRFPVQATEILRFLGPEWDILRTTTGYHQVLVNTDRLGIFVAAAAPAESTLSRIVLWAFYCAAGVGLIWVIVRAVRARESASRSRPT